MTNFWGGLERDGHIASGNIYKGNLQRKRRIQQQGALGEEGPTRTTWKPLDASSDVLPCPVCNHMATPQCLFCNYGTRHTSHQVYVRHANQSLGMCNVCVLSLPLMQFHCGLLTRCPRDLRSCGRWCCCNYIQSHDTCCTDTPANSND